VKNSVDRARDALRAAEMRLQYGLRFGKDCSCCGGVAIEESLEWEYQACRDCWEEYGTTEGGYFVDWAALKNACRGFDYRSLKGD